MLPIFCPQGQERRVMIISCVRSSPEYVKMDETYKLGFLKNSKRCAHTFIAQLLLQVHPQKAKDSNVIERNKRIKTVETSKFLDSFLSKKNYFEKKLSHFFFNGV